MSVIRQVAMNTVTGWGAVLIRTGLAFYMVPFLLQQMGRSGYGIVGLLSVLLSLSAVIDLGLRQALGRELAEQVARDDRATFNELLNTGFVFYIIMGILMAISCLVFADPMVSFFKVPVEMRSMAVGAVRIYGAGAFMLSFISAVYTAALTSGNRFDLRNNIESGSILVTNVMMLLVLSHIKNSLYGWVFVMLTGQLLMMLLYIVAVRRACPWMDLNWKYFRFNRAKSLIGFGWKVYILQLTNMISERSDPLVISRFFGPTGVALYSPGSRLSGILRPIVLTLSTQLHPLATQQHVDNAEKKQQRMLIDGTRYTLLMGTLFSVGLFVFAEPFCLLWLGKALGEDYRIVVTVVQLWAVVDLQICTASMQWPMMLGARRLNAMMIIHGSTAILNIALSIYFTGYTSMGIPGVLVGTILTGLILRPLLIWYGAKVFNIPLLIFVKKTLVRAFILVFFLLPIAYGIRYAIAPDGYLSLLACGSATGAAWLILLFCIGFTSAERFWISNRIKGVFSHLIN